jgi:hypothetical protein
LLQRVNNDQDADCYSEESELTLAVEAIDICGEDPETKTILNVLVNNNFPRKERRNKRRKLSHGSKLISWSKIEVLYPLSLIRTDLRNKNRIRLYKKYLYQLFAARNFAKK